MQGWSVSLSLTQPLNAACASLAQSLRLFSFSLSAFRSLTAAIFLAFMVSDLPKVMAQKLEHTFAAMRCGVKLVLQIAQILGLGCLVRRVMLQSLLSYQAQKQCNKRLRHEAAQKLLSFV